MKSLKVSIVIPAYNASKTLGLTLESIKKQDSFNKKDFEIIVVDDGSTDETIKVARNFGVKVLKQNHGGPAKARNFGVSKSKGEIIVFIDSDCIAEENWLKNLISPFKDKDIGAVGGPYSDKDISNNLVTRFINTEMGWRYSKIKSKYLQGWGSYNLAVRRSLFLKLQGFDESYKNAATEDWDFTNRINAKNYKIIFKEDSKVQHHHDVLFLSYLKRQYIRGKWRMKFYFGDIKRISGKDEYTGNLIKFQVILAGLFFLSLPLIIIKSILFFVPEFIILLLYLSNYELGIYSYKKYRDLSLSIVFMFFQTIRIFFLFFGMLVGIKNIILRRWKN